MKVPTEQEKQEHYHETVKGGIKGVGIGLGVTLGLALIAQRFSPTFRKLTLPFKAFLVSSGTSAASIIFAERAGLEYERKKYGYYEPEIKQVTQDRTSLQKTKDFISENRYGIATSAWALSIVGSLAYTYNNKYLSLSQKVVQARMYAQALTIVLIAAAAAISVNDKGRPRTPVGQDHWKDLVAAEERKMNEIS
uniref:Altered inheritance rate of mitochondria protein 38 n=1 Tax=Anthurium amnicola TaxID=1678845 RepID=A0A1D1YYU4_9ARAE